MVRLLCRHRRRRSATSYSISQGWWARPSCCPNATCGQALESFPPTHVSRTFAVSFVNASTRRFLALQARFQNQALGHEGLNADQAAATRAVRQAVSKIAKLIVDRRDYDAQAEALKQTNVVFASATYAADLVAAWVPDPNEPTVH